MSGFLQINSINNNPIFSTTIYEPQFNKITHDVNVNMNYNKISLFNVESLRPNDVLTVTTHHTQLYLHKLPYKYVDVNGDGFMSHDIKLIRYNNSIIYGQTLNNINDDCRINKHITLNNGNHEHNSLYENKLTHNNINNTNSNKNYNIHRYAKYRDNIKHNVSLNNIALNNKKHNKILYNKNKDLYVNEELNHSRNYDKKNNLNKDTNNIKHRKIYDIKIHVEEGCRFSNSDFNNVKSIRTFYFPGDYYNHYTTCNSLDLYNDNNFSILFYILIVIVTVICLCFISIICFLIYVCMFCTQNFEYISSQNIDENNFSEV